MDMAHAHATHSGRIDSLSRIADENWRYVSETYRRMVKQRFRDVHRNLFAVSGRSKETASTLRQDDGARQSDSVGAGAEVVFGFCIAR